MCRLILASAESCGVGRSRVTGGRGLICPPVGCNQALSSSRRRGGDTLGEIVPCAACGLYQQAWVSV